MIAGQRQAQIDFVVQQERARFLVDGGIEALVTE